MPHVVEGTAPVALRPAGSGPEVPFALFETVTGGPRPLHTRVRDLIPAAVFAALHLSFLFALQRAAPAGEPGDLLADLESVTYLDVPPPAEPESPRGAVKPRPLAVSEAVTIPAAQGEVVHPDKAAGFQELLAPRELSALPPPTVSAAPVDERDYSGRGVVGGVAGGKPPPALPAALAAEMAREGRLSDALVAARPARRLEPVQLELVDVKPELLNREEVMKQLLAHYPPLLKAAGIEGSATIQFVVDSTGTVEEGTVTVLRSTHELFARAAVQVARYARFSPGRMSIGGRLETIPVVVRAPLSWRQSQ